MRRTRLVQSEGPLPPAVQFPIATEPKMTWGDFQAKAWLLGGNPQRVQAGTKMHQPAPWHIARLTLHALDQR